MKNCRLLILFSVSITVVSGCAVTPKKPLEKIVEVPVKTVVNTYLQKAAALEESGDQVGSLRQYKIAMAVSPSNEAAREGRKRLEEALHRSAEGHYEAGLKFYKEGKYGHARHEFLVALRLWPDHPEVTKMLTSRKRMEIKRYIVHTIESGQSLSHVAKIYYGDYHKFPIIAKYNNITDATRIYVGQKIKVPEIEGMEFLAGNEAIKSEKKEVTGLRFWDWNEMEAASVTKKKQETTDLVAFYRANGLKHFKKKQYKEALIEFNKALNISMNDRTSLEYSYKANYQIAMKLFKKKDYMGAKNKFETSLRYNNNCRKCHAYIKKSENSYKEIHYKKGIQYFGREKLVEAIKEWELVRDLDPNYKRVEYHINKARTILKKLEVLKEGRNKKQAD